MMDTNTQASSDVAENRQNLSRSLQLYGYSACREALMLLEDHFSSSSKYPSIEDYICQLNKVVTFDIKADTSVIDPELAYLITRKMSGKDQVPQVDLDTEPERAPEPPEHLDVRIKNVPYKTIIDKGPTSSIHKIVDRFTEKDANEFNFHYNFLLKRLASMPIFQGDFHLTRLSTLTGSNLPSIRCICFGLLVKDISKIDSYMLIDSSGRVPVRIGPDTNFRNRLAFTNCIVIIEGIYTNPEDILFAANIGLPPILLDPIQDKSLACASEKLVVLLKEIYLDDEDVCRDLDLLFTGYNSMQDPPILFILIGDFTREPCEPDEFKCHMKKLAKIIKSCDNLRGKDFVFVPGLHDTLEVLDATDDFTIIDPAIAKPNQKPKLPRPPLSKQQIPANFFKLSNFCNIHLATNPTHIYLGNRLVTIVSHSYLKELWKNLLHDLSDHREELFDTARQIILSNGHLASGISRTFHSSLNLWHRPDLLVLADTEAFGNRYDYSECSQTQTTFTTLPSFSRQSSQFRVYNTNTGEIDDSQVSSNVIDVSEDDDDDEKDVQRDESEPTVVQAAPEPLATHIQVLNLDSDPSTSNEPQASDHQTTNPDSVSN